LFEEPDVFATWLSVVLLASPAPAAPMKLVTAPWRTANVEASLAGFYLEALAKDLRANGLSVITSDDIAATLGLERQRQLLNCSEGSNCLAELGNALGCSGIVVVSLAKLDATLTATVRIVSALDGRVLAEVLVESSNQRAFLDELARGARTLALSLGGPSPQGAAGPSRALPLTLGIAGLAVGAAGGVSLVLAWNTSSALDIELKANGLQGSAGRLASTGKLEQLLGWAGIGVGAAALLGAIIVWVADAPAVPAVGFVLTQAGGAVTFAGAF
jgi:hypothetical protein